MTRDEAKKQMRLELERDIDPVRRTTFAVMTHDGKDYTAEELMQEVEKDSEFGNQLLDSWLGFQQTGDFDTLDFHLDKLDDGHNSVKENIMDQKTKDRVIALMQKDLDDANKNWPTWSDTPSVPDDHGNLLTPNQAFQQVKDGTEFGNVFAQTFLNNYIIQETVSKAMGVPMPTFENTPTKSDRESN